MKIVTSLSFRGQCREAFEFYAGVLGGRITAAFPYADGPADMPVGDQAIMGADMDVDWAPNIDKPKNGFDISLHSDDVAEARRWYDALVDGGKPTMPFAETFWSPGYGGLIDRFGVPWMVNTIPGEGWPPKG